MITAALDQVLQLADVAGKAVVKQRLDRALAEAGHVALVALAVVVQEVAHQQRDVVAALAQRRQVDGEDIEPVEQVFAEAALAHGLAQVDVGGRHHAARPPAGSWCRRRARSRLPAGRAAACPGPPG
jgi:hypothetical protein